MSAHRLFNWALVVAFAGLLGVVGPALDGEPYESPSQVARAARAAGDADGTERLNKICRARHGDLAEVRWTAEGPVCSPFSGGRHLVAQAK